MSRYSQRSAQRPASSCSYQFHLPLSPRTNPSSDHRPQGYFNTSAPTGYSDHDDEQATVRCSSSSSSLADLLLSQEVATDISALPLPHHHNAHASFNRTPVSSTQYFNRHLPPQAIEQHSRRGAPALSVPSGRPRASSLENRYSRPTAAALRQLQHAQSDSESEPESDEDKFTAVGTGIQTDLDLEDEVAHSTVQRQYERDPRDGKQHYRTHSALEAHDHRLSLGIKPKKDGSTEIRMKDRTKNVVMQAYSDEEVDPRAGRAYGPAPPRAIVRPSSAGSMRPGVSIYARPPKAVPKKAPVVEDSPEEKNLIRLLKVSWRWIVSRGGSDLDGASQDMNFR